MRISEEIITVHPQRPVEGLSELTETIEATFACQEACTSCADACLAEDNVLELIRCIRINQDCADICDATGKILLRQTAPDADLLNTQLRALATACMVCADECERHAGTHEHCRVCAEACRRCERTVNRLLATFSPTQGLAH